MHANRFRRLNRHQDNDNKAAHGEHYETTRQAGIQDARVLEFPETPQDPVAGRCGFGVVGGGKPLDQADRGTDRQQCQRGHGNSGQSPQQRAAATKPCDPGCDRQKGDDQEVKALLKQRAGRPAFEWPAVDVCPQGASSRHGDLYGKEHAQCEPGAGQGKRSGL